MTEKFAVDLEPGTHKQRAARPRTPRQPLSPTNRNLIVRLAQALQTLEEAADPRRSSPIEGQMRVGNPSSEKDEGRNTRWARSLENRIHNRLRPLLAELDRRLEGSYEPPPKREKVRCVKKSCSVYGKRIPRFMGPAESIENLTCQVCGNKLTQA